MPGQSAMAFHVSIEQGGGMCDCSQALLTISTEARRDDEEIAYH